MRSLTQLKRSHELGCTIKYNSCRRDLLLNCQAVKVGWGISIDIAAGEGRTISSLRHLQMSKHIHHSALGPAYRDGLCPIHVIEHKRQQPIQHRRRSIVIENKLEKESIPASLLNGDSCGTCPILVNSGVGIQKVTLRKIPKEFVLVLACKPGWAALLAGSFAVQHGTRKNCGCVGNNKIDLSPILIGHMLENQARMASVQTSQIACGNLCLIKPQHVPTFANVLTADTCASSHGIDLEAHSWRLRYKSGRQRQ